MKALRKSKEILKFVIIVVFVFGLNSSITAQNPAGFDKMTEKLVKSDCPIIDSKRLEYLMTQEVYILDTREKKEYDVGHIDGAIHVGYEYFKMNSVKYIPKDAIIVTYCSVGYRSGKIGDKLRSEGHENVFNLMGGIFDWVNHDNAIYDSKGNPSSAVHGYNKKWSKWVNLDRCNVTIE